MLKCQFNLIRSSFFRNGKKKRNCIHRRQCKQNMLKQRVVCQQSFKILISNVSYLNTLLFSSQMYANNWIRPEFWLVDNQAPPPSLFPKYATLSSLITFSPILAKIRLGVVVVAWFWAMRLFKTKKVHIQLNQLKC